VRGGDCRNSLSADRQSAVTGGTSVTGSVAVDVALGLVFTYLVFSTLCSGVNEALSRFMNRRGRELFDTINGLLGDVATQQQFWDHPLITGLFRSRNVKATNEKFIGNALDTKAKDGLRTKQFKDIAPSYISPSTFAKVLLDISGAAAPSIPEQPGVAAGLPASIRIPAVEAIVKTVDPTRVQAEIENWFNDAMDRLSGYYKRWTKRVLLVLSVLVVIAFNVNTIQLAQSLWREPAVRSGVVQAAQNPTNPGSPTAASQAINQAINLPLGWSSSTWHVNNGQWLWTIVGWLLSIGAISLGAPFWFGLLSKFNSLRSTGPPPTT
jgi:hypothetical protein